MNQISLALAVTGDGNIDQLGDSDDWNLGVQDDAEIKLLVFCKTANIRSNVSTESVTTVSDFTYSEAMLISGASKQISSAILFIYIFSI